MERKRRILKEIEQHIQPLLLAKIEKKQEVLFEVHKEHLLPACQYIHGERKARLFTMVGNDERQLNGSFCLYYVFAIDEIHFFVTIKIALSQVDPTFPSLSAYIPALDWYEREVNDLLGLRAIGHPNRVPLVLHGDSLGIHPLCKDYVDTGLVVQTTDTTDTVEYLGENVTQIPVGPIHAGIIEPGHFRFGAVGDTILHLDAKLFYTHRGIEKTLEGKTLQEARFLIERICCVCNVSHSASFAQAVESAAGIEISQRAKFLRCLYLELERLYNHVGDVGNICSGYGFAVGSSQGARLKEQLLQLNERLTGHRYLRGIIVPGGVNCDLDEAELALLMESINEIDVDFQEFVDILLGHEIAMDRMETTGELSLQQVDDFEAVGIAARASGRDVDCRRDFPYAAYEQLDFAVVLQTEGDVLARIKVRIVEAFNSMLLIRQILSRLPEGASQIDIPVIEPYTSSLGWSESARGENAHWVMFDKNNTIYRYRVRSAAYSNWPVVPLAVAGNIIPDFPLINKSFELCYACCDR